MLEGIKKKISIPSFSYKHMIILIVVIIFIIAAKYTYNLFVLPKLSNDYVSNKEFSDKSNTSSQSVDIYFFYTTWCPHCKKSMPAWKSFKEEIGNKKVKDYTVNFFEVDCDKDTTLANKFNIEGYPTIKLVNGNQIIEYDAKPDKEILMQFLTTSL
jgi:thiol-disulfide isomerase/thioredoxin